MSPEMMNCPRIRELLTEFFEESLGAVNRARFRFHIWWCGDCRTHVEKMERLIEASGRLPPLEQVPKHARHLFGAAGHPSDRG
jgi:hypothetical protein